jgi:hypothetical protein
VLCYSRMLFFQCYPAFRRFDCKVFLTDALRYFSGAPVLWRALHNLNYVKDRIMRRKTRRGPRISRAARKNSS